MASSRVACASFNLGTNTTISITRDNSSYTHTLKYNFNGATGTIVTKTTQTTYVWTPPAGVFYSKIPNTSSGYGTITCETYNGNTLVGTTTCGFYAYAVKADCVPTVSGSVVDSNEKTVALTGDASKMVQYLSKPKCTLTATAKNSATIKTIQIENPVGLVATTSPYTFDTVYSKEFRFKATDSRGYSTTQIVEATGYIEYDPCYFDRVPVVARIESTSTTASATLTGYCFKGNFGKTDNAIAVKYRYKTSSGAYGSYTSVTPTWNSDGTFTATATIPNLSLSETYTIEFVVEDKLTSFPVETILGQGVGDLRIAKDYVQTKNDVIIGEDNNEIWKCVKVRRKVDGQKLLAHLGVGATAGGSTALELLRRDTDKDTLIGRIELRTNGRLYNAQTSRAFAEIASTAPSVLTDGGIGYMYLDGGESNPILIQWGRINKTPDGANVVTSQQIYFLWQYSLPPAVFVGSNHNLAVDLDVATVSPTRDGFMLYMKRANVANTGLYWFAIGNGTNSMPE